MKKRAFVTLIGMIAFVGTAGISQAQTRLGKDYAGGRFYSTHAIGDLERNPSRPDLSRNASGSDIFGHLNLAKHLDIELRSDFGTANYPARTWSYGQDRHRHSTALTSWGTIFCSFRPEKKVNPYLKGGLGWHERWRDEMGRRLTDSGKAILLGGGIEFDAGEALVIGTEFTIKDVGDYSSVLLGSSCGYSFSDEVMGTAGLGLFASDHDSLSLTLDIGIIYTF